LPPKIFAPQICRKIFGVSRTPPTFLETLVAEIIWASEKTFQINYSFCKLALLFIGD